MTTLITPTRTRKAEEEQQPPQQESSEFSDVEISTDYDVEAQQQKTTSSADTDESLSTATAPASATTTEEEEEKEEEFGFIELIIRALVPFFFYNLLTTEGRHEYCDLITEDPIGKALTWLPFALVLILKTTSSSLLLAIFIPLVVMTFIILVHLYHHQYKPIYPAFYWLNVAQWLAYLGMGIVYSFITPFDHNLIGSITVSSMFLAVLVSIIVRIPMTIQHTRHRAPKDLVDSPRFLKFNMILTLFWLLLLGIMVVSSWISYFMQFPRHSLGAITLGVVIPILTPLIGMKFSPKLVDYLKEKSDNDDVYNNNNNNNAMEPKTEEVLRVV